MSIDKDKLLHVATELLAAKVIGYGNNHGGSTIIKFCSSDETIETIVDMAEKLIKAVDERTE